MIVNVVEAAVGRETMLTGWFKANSDPVLIQAGARDCLYQDFPKRFVWEKRTKKWKVRQRNIAIGRMYSASPNTGEKFYLRLLLTVVKGKHHI